MVLDYFNTILSSSKVIFHVEDRMAKDHAKQMESEKLLLNMVTIKRFVNKFYIVDVEQ